MTFPPARRIGLLVLLAALAAAVSFVVIAAPRDATRRAASGRANGCAPGTVREREAGEPAGAERHRETAKEKDDAEGPAARGGGHCVRPGHPEGPELLTANAARASQMVAPFHSLKPGAQAAAVREAASLRADQASVPGADGTWTPLGKGPMDASDPTYDQTAGSTSEGFHGVTGRVEDLAYDPAHNRLFAAPVNGGVWQSDDRGTTWRSIGDGLPIQVVGSVAYSPAAGGTLLALTGDPAFGFESASGLGVYRSTDDGATWQRGSGVPNGALGFQLAVDPSRPERVYAATSAGLYRSDDAGATWQDVALPTGACAGHSFDSKGCYLANVVTDVVVQGAANSATTGANAKPGAVLAAVGWRAGQRDNLQSPPRPEAPRNGIYVSDDGSTGSFKFIDAADSGFVNGDQTAIGRVALGVANGPAQDHRVVYAVVQDANKFNGNVGNDVLDEAPSGVFSTIFNGVWVSSDFGRTWKEMESSNGLSNDQTTNSALEPAGKALSYEPGVQSWYNEWVAPDPTQQTAAGVPTRVTFGLEEIWENRPTGAQNGTSLFHVIGRYWNACQFGVVNGVPRCDADPQQDPATSGSTTHPDQHAGLYVPDADGKGVTLFAGSDGGVFSQHAAAGEDFTNGKWSNNPAIKGQGTQGSGDLALHTLQPYDVEMAKDGTAYMGLQDNGEGKILPDGTQKAVYGGDGFFTAVDPDHPDIAWEEYAGGVMAATTDGGKTWLDEDPGLISAQFSTPFKMDPANANHLLVGGRDIEETTAGTDTVKCFDPTCSTVQNHWNQVYDLGTMKHPGDANAADSTDPVLGDPADPNNSASAIELQGPNAYVGFCGFCDVITEDAPFHSGLATNVGGAAPPAPNSGSGWHIAAAKGLPNRFITSIATDPTRPGTVYVALGGYGRHWAPPGARGEDPQNVGTGHVFRSTDAGQSFTDISGDLPDTPADSITLHGDQVVVGTDIGAFISSDATGSSWAPLGTDAPRLPIVHLAPKPGNPDTLVVATYGRGAYTYRFKGAGSGTGSSAPTTAPSGATRTATPVACAASAGFRRAGVRPRKRGLRVDVVRRATAKAGVDVFQTSAGRHVLRERLVARFTGVRGAFSWNGRANVHGRHVRDGYYFVRFREPFGSGRVDYRRITLRRVHGRFRTRPSFYRHASCGLLQSYKLGRPVFGGSANGPLTAAYRLSEAGRVTVTVRRGTRVIHRFALKRVRAHRTYRLRLAAKRLRRADYRVTLVATAGRRRVTSTLVSRRL